MTAQTSGTRDTHNDDDDDDDDTVRVKTDTLSKAISFIAGWGIVAYLGMLH
jgi:hypothetical protein